MPCLVPALPWACHERGGHQESGGLQAVRHGDAYLARMDAVSSKIIMQSPHDPSHPPCIPACSLRCTCCCPRFLMQWLTKDEGGRIRHGVTWGAGRRKSTCIPRFLILPPLTRSMCLSHVVPHPFQPTISHHLVLTIGNRVLSRLWLQLCWTAPQTSHMRPPSPSTSC